MLPRQRRRAGLHLVPRPAPPAAAGQRGPNTIAAAASSATTRRAAPCRRPSGGRAGPGEDCIACHMPRPGRHEHPPHGGDRPPHPPRHARLGAGGPAGRAGSAGGRPADGLPLGIDDPGGASGRRARPGRGAQPGQPDHERRARAGEGRRGPGPAPPRGGGPRPPRRPVRPRIPRLRPGDPGTAARRRSAPTRRSSASNPTAS